MIGLAVFFVAGAVFGLARDFVETRVYQAESEPISSNEDMISEAQKMQIVLEDKKSAYLDCIYTTDDTIILNHISKLYEEPEFSFEKYSPQKLSKIIETLSTKKCNDTIKKYESLYKNYVIVDEEIFNRTNTVQKTQSEYSMRLFRLKGEAKEKGKFLLSKELILNELNK